MRQSYQTAVAERWIRYLEHALSTEYTVITRSDFKYSRSRQGHGVAATMPLHLSEHSFVHLAAIFAACMTFNVTILFTSGALGHRVGKLAGVHCSLQHSYIDVRVLSRQTMLTSFLRTLFQITIHVPSGVIYRHKSGVAKLCAMSKQCIVWSGNTE